MSKFNPTVGCDHRAVLIDGKRTLVLAGAIHYPRTTPDTWPELFRLTRRAGLNAVETYAFWNFHEPKPGVYDFSGRLDLKRFCRLAQEHGLYVILRIGPFICAEVNYGGFPFWLRNVPGIQMRTNNEPFKREMARWVRFLCDYLRPEFYPNGGPIVMSQIENEYFLLEKTYGAEGQKYLRWAVELTRSVDIGVPWVMCLGGVPGVLETINACYGHELIDKHFAKHPDQPALWTENWLSCYDTWGYPHHTRSAEDSAYALARFIAAGGTGNNYYMWHGGTNFGREPMYLQVTSYGFDAPIDEFGLPATRYHHLAKLHRVLNDHARELLNREKAKPLRLGENQSAFAYGPLTFLCNDGQTPAKVDFKGKTYNLQGLSALILNRGRVLMDTAKVAPADIVRRSFKPVSNPRLDFQTCLEPLDRTDHLHVVPKPIDQLQLTHDETDYCWYKTTFDASSKRDATVRERVLNSSSSSGTLTLRGVADFVYVYIDGKLHAQTQPPLLEERGPLNGKNFTQSFALDLTPGRHELALLCCGLGLIKGDWLIGGQNMVLERKGLWGKALWNGKPINGPWRLHPGLAGEHVRVFDDPGLIVTWRPQKSGTIKPLTWLKAEFAKPKDAGPWALDLAGLTKGMFWLNGQCLGRYWLTPVAGSSPGWINPAIKKSGHGQPTQRYYRLPTAWLKPKNTLVLLEESGGDPKQITLCRYQ